ncbi:MAG: PAS domain S-box protein [Opitutae bacterium]|nr:PAS domain S-box protein [Opitutae bacterium]
MATLIGAGVGWPLVAGAAVAGAVWLGWSRRKLARQLAAMTEAEARWRCLIDGATDAIVITDGETGLIWQVNRAAEEQLGYKLGELIGQHHTMVYPPDKREEMDRRFRARISSGGIGTGEAWVCHRSGERIPLEIRATPIQVQGRWFMQATVRDLRPVYAAQAAQRASEARFRALFDHAPVAVLEKDYTEAGRWLDGLRAEGVKDFNAYLEAHPTALAEQFVRCPVTAANRLALQRLGLPDVAAYNRVLAEQLPPLVVQDFHCELESLWDGQLTMTCNLDQPPSVGYLGYSLMHWSVPLTDGRPDLRRVLLAYTDLTELHAMADQLRTSEERSRLALQGFNVGIWETNFQTGDSYYSDRWKEMLGYEPEEISSRREEWVQRVHPDDRATVAAEMEAHLQGRTPRYETEHRLCCKDGSYKWVHSRGQVVRDAQARPVRIVGVHADISERKRAEAAVRASEDQYRRLFENNPSPMYVYDLETHRFLMVNEAAVALYGYTRAEFAQMTIFDLRPPSEIARLKQALSQKRQSGISGGIWQHRRKDGTVMFMDVSAHPHAFGGRPGVLVLAQDITQRHQAESRYRELFENAIEGVYETTREGVFRTVNPALARMFGYASPEEFFNADIRADGRLYVRPGRRAEFIELLGNNDSVAEFESEIWRRDGSVIWVSENVRAVRDSDGRLLYFHGFVTDVTARRRADEALRMSEERLRQLIEQADCMLWQAQVREVEGRLEWRYHVPASGLHRRLFGGERDAELTQLWPDAQVPQSAELQARSVAALRDGASGYQQEFLFRTAEREFWLAEKIEITPVATGRWNLVAVVIDVTARRQAEEALRASEARYRELVEHSPLAIAEYDITTIIVWLDKLRAAGVTDLAAYIETHPEEHLTHQRACRVHGVNMEAVRLMRAPSKARLLEEAESTTTAETARMRYQTLLAIWAGRNESEGETAFRALDGTLVRTFYHWWVPVLEGRPDYSRTQLLLVDLSDIVRAETALATERERLSVTLRAMTEGVITADTAGVVQFINEAAEKLTGWSAGSAVGHPLAEVCLLQHEKTGQRVPLPAPVQLAEARVTDLPKQSAVRSRAGGLVLVEGRVAAMYGIGGTLVGAVLVLRDVTERARLESELLRASKLESLGILAGGIAHDFNNLLTVVMGNLTLAMLDTQVQATTGRWLREAERGVMRTRDLTQQLLTFAKGGDPVRSAVILPDIVREATEFTLHGSKVRCTFELAANLWPADVDKGQVGQVVQNIVINAVQAMPEGGVIRVTLRNAEVAFGAVPALAAGRYLKLSLADTGLGIRPEHLPRIFDPYFTTKQQGSGLGLATVYSIVKKHQGHIEVESVLGSGTTFHIWLPAARKAPEPPALTPQQITRQTGRVLFMDDEEPIRRLAGALLQRIGFDPVVVADGAEVVRTYTAARAAGRPFDAVILDLTVPGGMGGLEAMQALREVDPRVCAIVSSGYSSDPVLANYRAHGFRGMVPKPYKITELAKVLASVLMTDESDEPDALVAGREAQ